MRCVNQFRGDTEISGMIKLQGGQSIKESIPSMGKFAVCRAAWLLLNPQRVFAPVSGEVISAKGVMGAVPCAELRD